MAESTLSVSYDDLKNAVGIFLGYGADSADWTAAQLAEIDRYVQSGVRRVYFPPSAEGIEEGYSWSFLQPTGTLATTADDSEQDLPDDFGRLIGDIAFEPELFAPTIVLVSIGKMLELRQGSESTGRPLYAAIRNKESDDGTIGQRKEIMWWPIPDATYTLYYQYEAFTGKLSDTNQYPLGGMRHSELYIESCLAVAEQQANDESGLHSSAFFRMLAAGISQDRKQGARFFGPMGSGDQSPVLPRHQPLSSYPITYKGETW